MSDQWEQSPAGASDQPGVAAASNGREASGFDGSHRRGGFDGTEGRIATQTWAPRGRPAIRVLIAHGYGEHIGRYDALARHLVGLGAIVTGPDHLGHGNSDGERALIADFEHVVDDLYTAGEATARVAGDFPTVLVGHSLGGLIAARYAERYPGTLAALVLSAPVLGTWSAVTDMLADPELASRPIDPATLSRDPAVGAAYESDPLVYHGPFRQQTLRAIAGTLHVVLGGEPLGGLPVLWLHGEDDQLVPLRDTLGGIEALRTESLRTCIYRGARHEVFNEINHDEVLADLTNFLAAAVPLARPTG